MGNRALGAQGLQLIKDMKVVVQEVDRTALRAKVEEASVRLPPGTSDVLGKPLTVRTAAGIDGNGNVRAVDTYDLVGGLAMMHLNRKGE